MEKHFWENRWQNGEIGFHQNEFSPYLVRHWSKLLTKPGSTVFVPLAGKSSDMLWFTQNGYSVIGVEWSKIAVEAFFSENNLPFQTEDRNALQCYKNENIELFCGDFFQLTKKELSNVGAAYDRASLIALPPNMRQQYAKHLMDVLPQEINILLVTMEYSQHEMDGPPFSVSIDEIKSLYESRFDIKLLESNDILAQNPRFQQAGLTALVENIYALCQR